MRIIFSESTDLAITHVVEALLDRIESYPTSVLGLATGRTMDAVYARWVQSAKDRGIDHRKCFFFMVDEYLGIPHNHPSSFRSYIEKKLKSPLNLRDDQFAFPGSSGSLEKAAEDYERLLKECGGVDIQLLGIGQNGHIGFNEPGSTGESRTRKVVLSRETMEANRKQFKGDMPTEAFSMGVGTILESKSVLMLVTGESKASVIKYLLNHHDDEKCPATYLKSHPHFTLVLDPAAASKVNLKI